jgi:hypothetical protein
LYTILPVAVAEQIGDINTARERRGEIRAAEIAAPTAQIRQKPAHLLPISAVVHSERCHGGELSSIAVAQGRPLWDDLVFYRLVLDCAQSRKTTSPLRDAI